VTDAQDRGPLAAIRSLHDAGFRVSAVADTRLASGLWTRACSQREVLAPVASDARRWVVGLERILRSTPHHAVVAGTDESLYAISLFRELLESHVRLGLPPHSAVQRALDKTLLADTADAEGIATPPAEVCTGAASALHAARAFGYPVFVKPLVAVTVHGGQLQRHPSRVAQDDDSLLKIQRELGTCIVQRRIEGKVVSLAGVSDQRGIVASVLVRHHRTWPVTAGSACFAETIGSDDELERRVVAMARVIGWHGLWQLQFIEGHEDGILYAIDFNPRLYGCLGIADAAGTPLAALWCASLLGQRPSRRHGRPGVHWRMEDTDARHALWRLRHGDYRGGLRVALPHRHTAHAYLRLRDPIPFAVRSLELTWVRLRRLREG
jgi:predicted ATP-grasp superfamily ATP-dependent carboligase